VTSTRWSVPDHAHQRRLLYDVLASDCNRLGFVVLGAPVFQDLVIARIVEPTSKVDALRVLDDAGADPLSYKTIQSKVLRCAGSDADLA
jgi:hypothetical protein